MTALSETIAKFKQDLYNLPSKEVTLKLAIADRLEGAQEAYLENIEKNFNYLLTRNNLRLLKTIKREQKRKEQEDEENEESEEFDDEWYNW